jgi:hypothetical protein
VYILNPGSLGEFVKQMPVPDIHPSCKSSLAIYSQYLAMIAQIKKGRGRKQTQRDELDAGNFSSGQ